MNEIHCFTHQEKYFQFRSSYKKGYKATATQQASRRLEVDTIPDIFLTLC